MSTEAMPFPSWPRHSRVEIDAVCRVLEGGQTNQWTGSEVDLFQREFASSVGSRFALATTSGTSALELCLRGLGVTQGTKVIVPARSYVATAMVPRQLGASVVLADCCPLSGNVTEETLERVRTEDTRVAIVAHVAGWPCEMDSIMEWGRRHDIRIVEDCAQACGASIHDRQVGTYGDAAAFSFCQDKIMSTGGEGGAVTTSDAQVHERMWSYRDHGKMYGGFDPSKSQDQPERLGMNLRMTAMQAAIGCAQLRQLPAMLRQRQANVSHIQTMLHEMDDIQIHVPSDPISAAWYMLPCRVPEMHRNEIMHNLQSAYPVRNGNVLDVIHGAPWTTLSLDPSSTPYADAWSRESILLPIHPAANQEDMDQLAKAIRSVIEQCHAGAG